MNQASAAKMREALKVVELFKKNGILFVPVPVTSDDDQVNLLVDAQGRLEQLAQMVEQEAA